ncbi:F-box protein At2g17036-like [Dendrobium catenatum]|uniref:F-box protein At2g17036-like n=1 Tax=Dendrobium catenatum TaxID=906689 RepID=UPI0010A060F1|nr:F-box protein At2g17036-like [Dendrobium catenatum]
MGRKQFRKKPSFIARALNARYYTPKVFVFLSELSLMANQNSLCSDLPIEILHEISNHLPTHKDLSSFRLVCSHWRNSAPIKPCLPLVLLKSLESYPRHLECRHPCSELACYKLHRRRRYIPQEVYYVYCSYKDWLLTASLKDHKTLAMTIYNPSTRKFISLAGTHEMLNVLSPKPGAIDGELEQTTGSLHWPYSICLRKLVLSTTCTHPVTSNKDNLVAMAILDYFGSSPPLKLVFCRDGDETWTAVNIPLDRLSLACVGGRFFYALGKEWRLYALDIGPPVKLRVLSMRPPGVAQTLDDCHLVGCCGDLLMVCHGYELNQERYVFEVFKAVNLEGAEPKWMMVEDLGDRAIFISSSTSSDFSIEAASEYFECRRNCIYFCRMLMTGYDEERCKRMAGWTGEYDLENGNITFLSDE